MTCKDAMTRIRVLCKQRRTCIQAGGLFGEWPIELAKLFDTVQTFEPEPNNYEILLANVEGINNISAYPYALGMVRGRVDMCRSNDEDRNPGAWYTQFGNEIKQIAIDNFSVDDVDLIYLDIEGGETDALLGAVETIKRCRPVIGLEDKKNEFWRRYGYTRSPVDMLVRDFNYVQVSHFNHDKILIPRRERVMADSDNRGWYGRPFWEDLRFPAQAINQPGSDSELKKYRKYPPGVSW